MENEERARALMREAALLLLAENYSEYQVRSVFSGELGKAAEEYDSAEWRALDIENGTVPQ